MERQQRAARRLVRDGPDRSRAVMRIGQMGRSPAILLFLGTLSHCDRGFAGRWREEARRDIIITRPCHSVGTMRTSVPTVVHCGKIKKTVRRSAREIDSRRWVNTDNCTAHDGCSVSFSRARLLSIRTSTASAFLKFLNCNKVISGALDSTIQRNPRNADLRDVRTSSTLILLALSISPTLARTFLRRALKPSSSTTSFAANSSSCESGVTSWLT